MPAPIRQRLQQHFSSASAAPPDRVAGALVLALLLFIVANAFRHPPAIVDQLDQSTASATKNTKEADAFFAKLTTNGNVLLRYQGFDFSTTAKQEKVMFEYIRANYAIYPRRIYVADANSPVPASATGDPFPEFSPAPAWLADHHVADVIVEKLQPDGTTRFLKLLPKQP
jgi:hypothetical protein